MKIPDHSIISDLKGMERLELLSTDHVWFRYVWEENERWNLHIMIDEETSRDNLHNAWGEIATARERLKDFEGSDPASFRISLLWELRKNNKMTGPDRATYADLASDLNFDALVFLLCAFSKTRLEGHNRAGLIWYHDLFDSLGISEEVTKDYEVHAREMLNEGDIPWCTYDGPINRYRVRDQIKQFNNWIKQGKVVLKVGNNPRKIHDIWFWTFTEGYWSKAETLLQAKEPEDFKKYSKRLDERKKTLLEG